MNFKHDKNCLSQPLKDVLIVPNSKPPEPKDPVEETMKEFWIVKGKIINGRGFFFYRKDWAERYVLEEGEKLVHVREVEQPKEEPVDNSKSNYKRVQAMKGESMEPQESPKLEQEERIFICPQCLDDYISKEKCNYCKVDSVPYIPESQYLALSDRLKELEWKCEVYQEALEGVTTYEHAKAALKLRKGK